MLEHLANAVLLLHLAVVAFVVLGLVIVAVGNVKGWRAVNEPIFRWLHLSTIAIVVLQSWLGLECPLTTLESWLRSQAGSAGYEEGFIEHWVSEILYYQAEAWVFALLYTVFGLAVAAAWIRWPPRRGPSNAQTQHRIDRVHGSQDSQLAATSDA